MNDKRQYSQFAFLLTMALGAIMLAVGAVLYYGFGL